jgi:GT2 family glycosyltransferase
LREYEENSPGGEKLDAMVISIGEPQLDRCLESVKNQTVPFSNIIHLDGVVPNSKAFNQGIRMVKEEWAMHIGGDMILYPNAVEIAMRYVDRSGHDEICGYCFEIDDTFLRCRIGFISVLRTVAFKDVTFLDTAFDDRKMSWRLREKGWRFRKPKHSLGTHFDCPNRFQIFCRFYFHACKFNDDNSYVRKRMEELYEKSTDGRYLVGLAALDFAKIHPKYPGSPNLAFNREMFREFEKWEMDVKT